MSHTIFRMMLSLLWTFKKYWCNISISYSCNLCVCQCLMDVEQIWVNVDFSKYLRIFFIFILELYDNHKLTPITIKHVIILLVRRFYIKQVATNRRIQSGSQNSATIRQPRYRIGHDSTLFAYGPMEFDASLLFNFIYLYGTPSITRHVKGSTFIWINAIF